MSEEVLSKDNANLHDSNLHDVNDERTSTLTCEYVRKPSLPQRLNRDPHNIHASFKIKFDDIFGEIDDEVHSYARVWNFSRSIFRSSKKRCYLLTTSILAVPMAILCGIHFALLSFLHVWCYQPCLKSIDMQASCVFQVVTVCLRAWLIPCCGAVGRSLSFMRLKVEARDGRKKPVVQDDV